MDKNTTPVAFHIDLTGDNGTPFRFEFSPNESPYGTVRYRDRRYTLTEGKPGYGINHTNENGQACGPAMLPSAFPATSIYGMRGWHEEDAWDVDVHTRNFVGLWLRRIADAHGLEL